MNEGDLNYNDTLTENEYAAATRIQSVVRGHQTRIKVAKLKEDSDVILKRAIWKEEEKKRLETLWSNIDNEYKETVKRKENVLLTLNHHIEEHDEASTDLYALVDEKLALVQELSDIMAQHQERLQNRSVMLDELKLDAEETRLLRGYEALKLVKTNLAAPQAPVKKSTRRGTVALEEDNQILRQARRKETEKQKLEQQYSKEDEEYNNTIQRDESQLSHIDAQLDELGEEGDPTERYHLMDQKLSLLEKAKERQSTREKILKDRQQALDQLKLTPDEVRVLRGINAHKVLYSATDTTTNPKPAKPSGKQGVNLEQDAKILKQAKKKEEERVRLEELWQNQDIKYSMFIKKTNARLTELETQLSTMDDKPSAIKYNLLEEKLKLTEALDKEKNTYKDNLEQRPTIIQQLTLTNDELRVLRGQMARQLLNPKPAKTRYSPTEQTIPEGTRAPIRRGSAELVVGNKTEEMSHHQMQMDELNTQLEEEFHAHLTFKGAATISVLFSRTDWGQTKLPKINTINSPTTKSPNNSPLSLPSIVK